MKTIEVGEIYKCKKPLWIEEKFLSEKEFLLQDWFPNDINQIQPEALIVITNINYESYTHLFVTALCEGKVVWFVFDKILIEEWLEKVI